jgi:CubicO group peptidase (beta-lactamase class C family)
VFGGKVLFYLLIMSVLRGFFVLFSLTPVLFWSSCGMPARSFVLLAPDYKDVNRMPALDVNAPDVPFRFNASSTTDLGRKILVNDWSSRFYDRLYLDSLLSYHPNQAFVIIRNDTVVYERYREEDPQALFPSYSVAKSFVSALVGFALQDSLIGSECDLVVDYLPDLSDDPRYQRLTIEHLLNHTSGLFHPLTVDGLLYYGNDLRKVRRHIRFHHEPGKVQAYMNINTLLLGLILEKQTGAPLNAYLEKKLWKPLGMEQTARWSTDRHDRIKPYCCLQATARDYAKLGRLYLNGGNWEGQQLLDRDWVNHSISRDTTEGGTFGYHHSWYIGYKGYDDFMAIGLYRQYLYVNRAKNIIIVSLNRKPRNARQKRFNWEDAIRQVVDQL